MSQRPCNSERFQKSDLIDNADVVEFHKTDDGSWIPFPVEYKQIKHGLMQEVLTEKTRLV
jgi:hypothetical protein